MRSKAPGPAVAKQKPRLSVNIAWPHAMNDTACSFRVMIGRIFPDSSRAII
jgi:hypothetical protein